MTTSARPARLLAYQSDLEGCDEALLRLAGRVEDALAAVRDGGGGYARGVDADTFPDQIRQCAAESQHLREWVHGVGSRFALIGQTGDQPATAPAFLFWFMGSATRPGSQVDEGELTADELLFALDSRRAAGDEPADYADLLRMYHLTRSTEAAGIDLSAWDPELGAHAMLPFLTASYRYYGELYLDNNDLQWAGMAGMIGPTFAGGMFDLEMLSDFGDIVSTPLDVVPDWAKGAVYGLLPPPVDNLALLGEISEAEFEHFEVAFLKMQKEIFVDQMPMHNAYLESGLDGIEEMYEAGIIDARMLRAWQDVDSGDPGRIADGNAALLRREQEEIIGDDYDDMRGYHGPVGEVLTYMMGAIGDPGIPGAKTLAQHDPLEVSVELRPTPIPVGPHVEVTVETPLPAGNISNFDTRWDLIENDTLPAFLDLIKNDPDRVEDILSGDVGDRIEDARILNNLPELLGRLSDWDVSVDGELW